MALERQTIEKKDFPIARRGYDTQAVDTHLRLLSEEVEELKRSSRRPSESLATTAAAEVQAIVAAAETAGTKIRGDAEREGDEIRREARNAAKAEREQAAAEARSTREAATNQAAQYVSNVSESTSALLGRVESIDRELGSVMDTLRGAGQRLQEELRELEGNVEGFKGSVTAHPAAEAASPVEEFEAATPEPLAEAQEEPVFGQETEAPGPEGVLGQDGYEHPSEEGDGTSAPPPAPPTQVVEPPAPPTSLEEAPGGGESPSDGARLIALNMALNGAPREEVDRYLEENFELADRGTLIDEVYAAIEE